MGCVVGHWGVSRVLPGVSMSGGGIAPDLALGCHGSSIRPSRGGVAMSGKCVTRGCRLGTYFNEPRRDWGKRTESVSERLGRWEKDGKRFETGGGTLDSNFHGAWGLVGTVKCVTAEAPFSCLLRVMLAFRSVEKSDHPTQGTALPSYYSRAVPSLRGAGLVGVRWMWLVFVLCNDALCPLVFQGCSARNGLTDWESCGSWVSNLGLRSCGSFLFYRDVPCSCNHLGGFGVCQPRAGAWFLGLLLWFSRRQSSFVICDHVFRAVSRPVRPSTHPLSTPSSTMLICCDKKNLISTHGRATLQPRVNCSQSRTQVPAAWFSPTPVTSGPTGKSTLQHGTDTACPPVEDRMSNSTTTKGGFDILPGI